MQLHLKLAIMLEAKDGYQQLPRSDIMNVHCTVTFSLSIVKKLATKPAMNAYQKS